jgi:hypothetical protein
MNKLKLSMLPSLRYDEVTGRPVKEPEDFVDDEVVLSLVAGTPMARPTIPRSDLALSSDDSDFAGWSIPTPLPRRQPVLPLDALDPQVRRPALPVIEEPGLGEPHRGSHRWWIAGLAGALSTMLFSLLLLTLSSRFTGDSEGFSWIKAPEKSKPLPVENPNESKEAPELTGFPEIK